MSIPDPVSADPLLPEQHLLRDSDRLQDYAGAFLRGEITAAQYSEMTLAEISRRAPLDPMEPLAEPAPEPPVVVHEEPPVAPATSQHPAPVSRPHHTDADRSLVLARAFVGGRISGPDFLRLVRDC